MNKKLLVSCMMAASALTLAGCGSDSSSGSSQNNVQNDPLPQEPAPGADNGEQGSGQEPQLEAANTFTLAVLPDTQKYSRYSPERFYAQTQWIAENYEQENIKFTAHLGDIVDIPDSLAEWDVARVAMGYLEESQATPYSVLAGNHDVRDSGQYDDSRSNSDELYLNYFGPERQSGIFPDNFGGYQQGTNADGRNAPYNTYYTFSDDDGQEYLVLAIDWNPSYCDPAWGDCINDPSLSFLTLEWVKRVLDEHPDTPTILTTHQLLNIAEDGETAIFTDKGTLMWNHLIRDYDQIFLTINGHHHGEAVMEANNKYGHKVVMEVVDYQSGYWGGDGMMQLVEFDKTNNTMNFRSYSPYVDAIPEAEREADQEVSRWSFSIPMDFSSRFANLNATNEDGSDVIDEQGSVEGSKAYWILDAEHIVGASISEVPDLSGSGNALTVGRMGSGDQSDYLQITDDKPPFGFAQGSVRFNGNNADGYFLTTRAGADIAQESRTNGWGGALQDYTIEATFKLPADWTPERGDWSGILTNISSIGTVCSYHNFNCSGGDPSQALAISSLREAQWISVNDGGKGADSFSWDLNRDQWYHVAITNDGHQTTMYVNGSLVMRTGEDEQRGLVVVGGQQQWRLGVSSWDGGNSDPFYGNIAEVRITNRVLPSEEWLYYQSND
ncbi:MAG: serine/threonine protein phosphatase [Oceanospirillaceae bacterium]|nr:serine/threonine protein phosphatase [Oceanospirillaceae bacterium]MBL33624.1 serine/threonine protein phosphatase [Oceanospirillaceae bacterium]MBS53892.1 serine/threonine protein phosphatase [Oceanospirillaceae bacterium]